MAASSVYAKTMEKITIALRNQRLIGSKDIPDFIGPIIILPNGFRITLVITRGGISCTYTCEYHTKERIAELIPV